MSDQDKFHWAKRVSRRAIQRLYESDVHGMLDEELLDQVHYAIHARVCDMFEVREAQQVGRVKCPSRHDGSGTSVDRNTGPRARQYAGGVLDWGLAGDLLRPNPAVQAVSLT